MGPTLGSAEHCPGTVQGHLSQDRQRGGGDIAQHGSVNVIEMWLLIRRRIFTSSSLEGESQKPSVHRY